MALALELETLMQEFVNVCNMGSEVAWRGAALTSLSLSSVHVHPSWQRESPMGASFSCSISCNCLRGTDSSTCESSSWARSRSGSNAHAHSSLVE